MLLSPNSAPMAIRCFSALTSAVVEAACLIRNQGKESPWTVRAASMLPE